MRVTIESLAHGGDAVARLDDGRVAFVRQGCPGDTAEIDIVAEHGSWVSARVTQLILPSPDRIEPPCPYFGVCGGCQWQHVALQTQQGAKSRILRDAFERIGHLTPSLQPLLAAPADFGYRNKVEFVTEEADGTVEVGLHRFGQSSLVRIERCLLLPERVQDAPRALAGALSYLAGRHGRLGVHRVGVRAARNTPDIEVSLWTEPGPFPRQIAAKTLADAIGATGVTRVLFKGPIKERRAAKVEVLGGRVPWHERLDGHRFGVSAPSFFQVNTEGTALLVARALDLLAPDPTDRVLDLYSGVGTFTVPLALRAGSVVAVEGSRHALADLRRNLQEAGASAEIVGGDVTRELDGLGEFDRVVVDPPRSGLEAGAVAALAATRTSRIVYVSCDPATLARDAMRLSDAGYGVDTVTPVDLFPQTYHVEAVASFDRVGD